MKKKQCSKVILNERIIIEAQNLRGLVVINEKKCREETEEALLEMLKELISKIKNQIETERKIGIYLYISDLYILLFRRVSQDYLIGLLQDIYGNFGKINELI